MTTHHVGWNHENIRKEIVIRVRLVLCAGIDRSPLGKWQKFEIDARDLLRYHSELTIGHIQIFSQPIFPALRTRSDRALGGGK